MTLNDLLAIVGVTLGVIAIVGITVTLWAACALAGIVDDQIQAQEGWNETLPE